MCAVTASTLEVWGTHLHTNKSRHTRHANSQIGRFAGVQAVTRKWTDAGVTISIGLSVGNNTLAGFSHETLLTRGATLKWSIHYLQITPWSCVRARVNVCVCGRTYSHYTLQPVLAAGEQWDGVSPIINSEIKHSHLRSQVQVCFPLCSSVMRQWYRTLCRRCWSIYYNHSGALFSLCFMACSCCSSILVFLSLVKCCHSPVFGCGPEGP